MKYIDEYDEDAPIASKIKVKRELTTTSASEQLPSKKVKKEFQKAGQRYDTPEELDVLRLFYVSLYNEELDSSSKNKPLSMAEKWCMERGIFDQDTQETLYKRYINASNKKKN
jgi:hypothetical protein